MKNFGYSIHKDRQIDYDANDKTVMNRVLAEEPSVQTCIACGGCTATCSAGAFVDFNIRRVHTFLRRGEVRNLKEEIRKCMFCGKCQLTCPRGVNLRNLILAIHDTLERNGL